MKLFGVYCICVFTVFVFVLFRLVCFFAAGVRCCSLSCSDQNQWEKVLGHSVGFVVVVVVVMSLYLQESE